MAKGVTDMRKELPSSREWPYFLNPIYIILLSFIPVIVGFFSGIQILLPLFITIPSFLVMRRWLMKGRVGTAYAEMLLSCIWMSIPLILLSLYFPAVAEKMIIKGPEYVTDMDEWLRTGGANEGTPSLFIPLHLEHLGIIMLASILTGGFLALFFGAMQMGYMNFYVAWLIGESNGHTSAYMLGWPIWSVIRVLSFVLIAVALAQPLLHWFKWKAFDVRKMFYLVILAIILEGVDIGLKIVLGPVNQATLHKVIEEASQVSETVAAILP